jgi:DNA-directed RNA polymerase subunit RPC12/RpoP
MTNQTGFKCIDCEKIFTDEGPTTLNLDDWLGVYEDYGPVCKACAKEIREGDYESIASW